MNIWEIGIAIAVLVVFIYIAITGRSGGGSQEPKK